MHILSLIKCNRSLNLNKITIFRWLRQFIPCILYPYRKFLGELPKICKTSPPYMTCPFILITKCLDKRKHHFHLKLYFHIVSMIDQTIPNNGKISKSRRVWRHRSVLWWSKIPSGHHHYPLPLIIFVTSKYTSETQRM